MMPKEGEGDPPKKFRVAGPCLSILEVTSLHCSPKGGAAFYSEIWSRFVQP